MKRAWRKTTATQTEQVRVFTLCNMPQKQIARATGLRRSTVATIVARLGLASRNAEPLSDEIEREIARRYQRGKYGSPRIARELRIPQWKVIQVLQAHRLQVAPGAVGCMYAVPVEIKRAVRREQRAFEAHVAKKYNLSGVWLRRFLRRRK
jgi:hypothetical protein